MDEELNMKIELLQDDLDGSQGADVRTVSFSVEGVDYEIDLGEDNVKQLFAALDPFTTAGRPLGRKSAAKPKVTRKPRATAPVDPSDPDSVQVPVITAEDVPPYQVKKARAWLKANGHEVADRGRLLPEMAKVYTDSEQYQLDQSA